MCAYVGCCQRSQVLTGREMERFCAILNHIKYTFFLHVLTLDIIHILNNAQKNIVHFALIKSLQLIFAF